MANKIETLSPVLTVGDKVRILGGTKWNGGQEGEIVEVQEPSAALRYKVYFTKLDRSVYFTRGELELVQK